MLDMYRGPNNHVEVGSSDYTYFDVCVLSEVICIYL